MYDFNYVEHLLILISAVTGDISISAFASLVGIPTGNTSSAAELKMCAITEGIKKYKSIIKKKRKKDNKKMLLAKKRKYNRSSKFKALIYSYISNEEFVSVNNVLREYNETKKKSKILKLLRNILYKYAAYRPRNL